MTYSIAVVCRKRGFTEIRQKQGWFSYPVPDFEWGFFPAEDDQVICRDQFANAGYDLIFWEDWVRCTWVGDAPIPIYAAIVDSNTSPRRRKLYRERVQDADVLLIDQDKLSSFNGLKKPTFRWQYAVNENVFTPHPKTVDAGYHVAKTDARGALGQVLRQHSQDTGYSLTMGGGMTISQYAARLGAARIIVHKPTFKQCRSHRYFDALASGACLLTERVWSVNEDAFLPGVHFAEWSSEDDLCEQINELLTTGLWQRIADAGRDHVLRFHTWQTRAQELIGIIERVQGVET